MSLDLTNNLIKNARAFIWKKEGGQLFFLITQESTGFFSIPGGCKELEDDNLMTTLQRELREELGLNPDDYSIQETNIKKEYENLYKSGERAGKKTVISIFLVSGLTKKPIAGNEIQKIIWVNAENVLDTFNRPHFKELFQLAITQIEN